jgi:hypothetical protein
MRNRSKAAIPAALATLIAVAFLAGSDVADRPAAAAVGPAPHQRSDGAQSSDSVQPFKAALLERKKLESGVRVRLLVFTRSTHERDGDEVRVLSNQFHRSAIAQERPRCGCDGLWVVTSRTPRGRRFLSRMQAKMRDPGTAKFGTQGGGAGAAFRIHRYNRKYRPWLTTA